MPDPGPADWRSRYSQRIAVDIRTGAVGYVGPERDGIVELRPVAGGSDWTAPASCTEPASPCEVAAALSRGAPPSAPTST